MRIALSYSLIALAAMGCSAGGDSQANAGGGATNGPGSGAGGDDGFGFGGGGDGDGGGSTGVGEDCSAAAQLVYVLSDENDLYSFKPDTKTFTKIGPLRCQTSMQPNSMAIDRNAVAWVNYVASSGGGLDTDGAIFKVSTKDGSCEPTGITLSEGWFRLGMGFATDAAGVTEERLFVTGTSSELTFSPGLGRLDPGATAVTAVGEFTGVLNGADGELTGTGDGRLFGFFTTTPVQLAEIDKATGEILSNEQLLGVERPTAWAFSFWGGDFYFYTAPDTAQFPQRTSNVTHYRPSDGSADTTYMTNIGFRIVGAGVSTCAPLEQPR